VVKNNILRPMQKGEKRGKNVKAWGNSVRMGGSREEGKEGEVGAFGLHDRGEGKRKEKKKKDLRIHS